MDTILRRSLKIGMVLTAMMMISAISGCRNPFRIQARTILVVPATEVPYVIAGDRIKDSQGGTVAITTLNGWFVISPGQLRKLYRLSRAEIDKTE